MYQNLPNRLDYVEPAFYDIASTNQEKPKKVEMVELDTSKLPKVVEEKMADVNVFNDYHERVNNLPKQEVQYVDANIGNNVNISEDALLKALANYRSLSDNDLRELIYNNFRLVLQKIFDEDNNQYKSIIFVFTDPKVIQILGEIIYRIYLSENERTYCNKLVYDYIKYANSMRDGNKSTVSAMRIFASIVNRDKIPRLMDFGYTEEMANQIAMVSSSSLDKVRNVKRLNSILIELPANFISEELITATYYTVFSSATSIMEGIMFDVQDISKYSDQKKENYTLINLALLSILNNLEDSKLNSVLLGYSQDRTLMYTDKPVRFNLRSFAPEDYPRLDASIRRLDYMNGSPLIY